MTALATITEYELLIGTVPAADEPRVTYLLDIGSAIVATVAPGVLPWLNYDETDPDAIDPGPVPQPVVLVTCQVTSRMVDDPSGASGAVEMERVGWVQTQYSTSWSTQSGLLPAGWRLVLKPWRPPDFASIRLSVPHPAAYGLGGVGGDWWADGDLADGTGELSALS